MAVAAGAAVAAVAEAVGQGYLSGNCHRKCRLRWLVVGGQRKVLLGPRTQRKWLAV